jgi:hypothetical protein
MGFFQTFLTFMSGTLGVTLIAIASFCGFVWGCYSQSPRAGLLAIGCGALAYLSIYICQTMMMA